MFCREFTGKPLVSSRLPPITGPNSPIFVKIPCIFPDYQGIGAETGSQQTAPTATLVDAAGGPARDEWSATAVASGSIKASRARPLIARFLPLIVLLTWVLATPYSHVEATQGDSLTGKLLVATNEIGDPRFAKTVIYMLHHDPSGAMGLVVNRPIAQWSYKRLLKEMGQDGTAIEGELDIFYGGPVDPQRGFVLHSLDYTDDRTRKIGSFSGITTSPTIVRAIAEGRGPRKYLIVFGYAGWGAGQLDDEIDRRAWTSVDADEPLVLGSDHENKWDVATAKRGVDL